MCGYMRICGVSYWPKHSSGMVLPESAGHIVLYLYSDCGLPPNAAIIRYSN